MLKSVYAGLSKVSDILQKIIEAVLAILIATSLFDLLFQIAYRFIIIKFVALHASFTEEYARYAMIWIAYLGIAVCFKEGTMPTLNLLTDAFKGKAKYVLYAITRILMLMFLYVGIRYGFAQVLNMLNYRSPVMYIPGVFLYSAPFLACVLLLFEMVIEIIGVISGELQPFESRGKGDADIVEAM